MNEQVITLQYAVNPTEKQADQLSSHSGAVRFAYNYGLNKVLSNWTDVKEGRETKYLNTTAYSLRKMFNAEKHEIAPWWAENSKEAYSTGFNNLHVALQRFYKKTSGLPRFKSKLLNDDEGIVFTTNTRKLEDDRRHFTVPTIGRLKLHERANKLAYLIRHGGRITNVTLRYARTRWFLSVNVRVSQNLFDQYHLLRTKKDKKKVVGVDVGIKSAAVFSDGTVIENPRSYEKQLRKLRKLNKELSRRKKFDKKTGEMPSKHYEKTKQRLRKVHAKVTNQEKDFAHKLSKQLVDEYRLIGLEDLNVAGMIKNKRLSRHIAHASFGRLREMTQYKAGWYKSEVGIVDRFFASSKTCSSCKTVKAKLSLNERVFNCESCDLSIDRDLNAAINIRDYVLEKYNEKHVAQSCGETLNDHGGESSGQPLVDDETIPSEVISTQTVHTV